VITRLAGSLTAGNHSLAVEIAGLPDPFSRTDAWSNRSGYLVAANGKTRQNRPSPDGG
jgi:hypothetical protein